MNDSAASLDRLHDIVVPAPVPMWPPASGWYVVMALAVGCLALLGYRWWRHWRANAYRRAALQQLAAADSAAEIAAILRRTALAIAPRRVVAAQTGESWPEWLANHCSAPMSAAVRNQLSIGIYREPKAMEDVRALKAYAARWISDHQDGTAAHRVVQTAQID